jgi:hypothetical protein
LKFQIDGSNNYLFQEMSSITEKSQFQKLRMGCRKDTAEDRMIMKKVYSNNQSKVQKRYSRGQKDDVKVQQKTSPKSRRYSRGQKDDVQVQQNQSKVQKRYSKGRMM